jgi:hypothetical protein
VLVAGEEMQGRRWLGRARGKAEGGRKGPFVFRCIRRMGGRRACSHL